MRMPPGYRFVPTDYELVKYHLINKINNRPSLIQQIKEVHLYNYDPHTLAETHQKLGDNDWYFFTPTNRKYPNGDRPSRSAGNGYWKATGSEKQVYEGNVAIGKKRTLVYYNGTYHNHVKTNWIMHEYRAHQPPRSKTHANDMKLEDWVLCRMYKKANSKLKVVEQMQETKSADGEPGSSSSSTDGSGRERGEGSGSGSGSSSSNGDGGERVQEEASAISNEDPNGSGGLLDVVEMQYSYWDSIDITTLLQDHAVPSLD